MIPRDLLLLASQAREFIASSRLAKLSSDPAPLLFCRHGLDSGVGVSLSWYCWHLDVKEPA